MHIFDYSKSHNDVVKNVDVARFEQYSATQDFPFKAMWYRVPPNENSPLDQHSEFEFSVVVRGTASVETGGVRTTVHQGSAFLLESGEAHIVHNPDSVEPLLVFSAYWFPSASFEQAFE